MGIIVKKYIAIAFVVGIVVGFFLNKQGDQVIVKEVKGEPIKEVVYLPYPAIEYAKLDIASLPQYVFKEIVKVDTITNIMVVDTLAILKDYTAIKHYSYTLFDNEHGKLNLSQKAQYNSLVYTDYTYTPIKRVESKLKRWQVLVGAGANSKGYSGFNGGLLYRNIGIIGGYRYNFSDNKSIVDVSLMYRL